MKLSPKYKKYLKVFVILWIVRFIISIILYFAIEYNFKQIIQAVVKKETKGTYSFESSTMEVSLWNKSIIIKNATVVCNDTLHSSPHYDVLIPKVYLTIQSWKDIIIHQTFAIDSLAVISPTVKVHDHHQSIKDTATSNFHVSDIMTGLQKALVHLRVRALVMQNGSFTYSRLNSEEPLIVNNINFSIFNFSKENNDSSHLFSSDDINISMSNQNWALPDGFHNIKFHQLRFSGKNRLFELDSCYIHTKARGNKGEITLSADKLFFNSAQLSAIYQKQQLIIDTLICIKPILTLPGDNKKDTTTSAKVKAIKKSTDFIFDYINFNYISITEGQLVFTNKKHPSYGTQKANLQVYNLQVNPDSSTKIEADSILFNVKDLKFVTNDSMFQLAVDEFVFKNSDIVFNHAVFGPTPQNKSGKGLTFSTPSLYLKNISLDALIEKRLKATEAFLYHPVITVSAIAKKKTIIRNNLPVDNYAQNSRTYKILHSISELIDVDNFHIINGNLQYKLSGTQPLTMTMKNVNADILLHHFFLSDSMIDIKRSMPRLDIGQIAVHTGGLNLEINNYGFRDANRHNYADNFLLTYGQNLLIKGTQLSWQILDWDQYVNYKKIMIDHIQIKTLLVNSKGNHDEEDKKPTKDLPYIHVDRLDVDNLDFNKSSVKNNLHLNATAICLDNINSFKRFFTWDDAMGVFSNVKYSNSNTTVSVKKITLDNKYTNLIEGAYVELHTDSSYTKLDLPIVKITGDLHTSDFSSDKLHSLTVENPTININTTSVAKKKSKDFSIPVDFDLNKLIVNNAHLHYITETAADTASVIGKISINADQIQGHKSADKALEYKKIAISLSDFKIKKTNFAISMPQSSIQLDNGVFEKNAVHKLEITSGVILHFKNATIKSDKADSTALSINNISGTFEDNTFSYYDKMKVKLAYLLSKSELAGGQLHVKGKTQTINIQSYSWLPSSNILQIKNFDITPNLSKEETFKTEKWQADYMVIKGDEVTVNNLHINQQKNDSSITASKLTVTNVSLTASRDKRIPFQHNIEKSMPTKLINAIKIPFGVNEVVVENGTVTVQETAVKTGQTGVIPIKNINAVLTNVTNINNQNKNLTLNATASLFDTHIKHFYYSENYGDSLSNFTMAFSLTPVSLVEFGQITKPLASISIEKGKLDTLFASWAGNKYAATGKMNLYYKDLSIKILNPTDPTKKSLKLKLENTLAGSLINSSNKKESLIFFERDREKFIFNYWVKTVLQGALSSAGLKKDKKYIKQYNKLHKTRPLPPIPTK